MEVSETEVQRPVPAHWLSGTAGVLITAACMLVSGLLYVSGQHVISLLLDIAWLVLVILAVKFAPVETELEMFKRLLIALVLGGVAFAGGAMLAGGFPA
jgi:hypothetical protein